MPKHNSSIRHNTFNVDGITPEVTPEGFYIFRNVKVARIGLFPWLVSELEQDGIRNVFPELRRNEVVYLQRDSFDQDMLAKLQPLKITNDHPRGNGLVTPKNVKQVGVGSAANPYMDEEWLCYGIIVVEDEQSLMDLNSGKVELSIGYTYQTPVEFIKGLPYVAKEVIIRLNHIAIVKKGRAGDKCRFNELEEDMSEETVKQVQSLTATVDQFKSIVSNMSLRLNTLEQSNKLLTEKKNELVSPKTNGSNERGNSGPGIGIESEPGPDSGDGAPDGTESDPARGNEEVLQETTQAPVVPSTEFTRTNSGEPIVTTTTQITHEQIEQFSRENDMFFTATTDMQALLKVINTNGLIGLRDGKEFTSKDKTRLNKLIDEELNARKTQEAADELKNRANSAVNTSVSLNDALGI
jgi:hypothetical protein